MTLQMGWRKWIERWRKRRSMLKKSPKRQAAVVSRTWPLSCPKILHKRRESEFALRPKHLSPIFINSCNSCVEWCSDLVLYVCRHQKKQHIFMIIVIYTVEKCIFIFTNHFNSKIFTKICYALILVTILTVWLVFLQFLCLFPFPGWWFIGYIQFRLCFSFFVLQCSCIIINL